MEDKYDIIVVGGGHAGAEAALISARMGVETLLVTSLLDAIARMPCNPSIGGLAKSHLVFELDALGGEMGFNADLTSLQEKTLNTSRGPAVQATRAQCDKSEYTRRMQRIVASQPHLRVFEDSVVDIKTQSASQADGVQHTHVTGVETEHHGFIPAKCVILTTGTSLRGRIFVGKEATASGGDGRPAVDRLSESLNRLGFTLTRLKTGTPPRLAADSIDFSKASIQTGEENPYYFSLRTRFNISHIGSSHEPRRLDSPSFFPIEEGNGLANFHVPASPHEPTFTPKTPSVSTWKHDLGSDSQATINRVSTWKRDLFTYNFLSESGNAPVYGTNKQLKCNDTDVLGISMPTIKPISYEAQFGHPDLPSSSCRQVKASVCVHSKVNVQPPGQNPLTAQEEELVDIKTPENSTCDNIATSVFTWKHADSLADYFAPWPVNSLRKNCYITHTTLQTHEIIRTHLQDSALYGGAIEGTGVR